MSTKNDLWWRTTLLCFHSYTFMFMGNMSISPGFISNKKLMGKELVCVSVRWWKSGTQRTLPLVLEDSLLKRPASFGRGIQPDIKPGRNIKTDWKYGISVGRKVFKAQNVLSSCVFKKRCLVTCLVEWNILEYFADFIEHILYQKFRIKCLAIQSID